jgi:hypothetical protein
MILARRVQNNRPLASHYVLAAPLLVLAACGAPSSSSLVDVDTTSSGLSLPAGNLVTNPSFEKNLDGWYEWQGTGAREHLWGAPNGHYVAEVTCTGGSMYSIGDSAPLVASIPSNVAYHASAYVRAASSSSEGKPVTLILRERNPAGDVARLWSSTSSTLGSTFQELTTVASSPTPGNVLDLYILQEGAESGDAFFADAVAVTQLSTSPSDAGAPHDSGTKPPADSGAKPDSATDAHDSGSVVPLGVSGSWTLIFDDEFNASALDTSTWAPYWFANGDQSNGTTMESSNVSMSGGTLNLTLTAAGTGGLVSTNPNGGATPGFQFTYGFLEARIFLPASGSEIANWPAWWADGQDWPTDGEIDVIEGLGGTAAYHFHDPSGGPGASVPGNYTGWHTYGANWQPGSVTYYYDGVAVGSITSGITSAPMYLILENSGGAYGGPAVEPATMQVDYARVWQ